LFYFYLLSISGFQLLFCHVDLSYPCRSFKHYILIDDDLTQVTNRMFNAN